MEKRAMSFDTLKYVKRLIAAGCDRQIAESIAETHAEAQNDFTQELQKQYLTQEAFDQKTDSMGAASEKKYDSLEKKIDNVEITINQRIDALELTLNQKIDNLDAKFESKFDRVYSDMEKLGLKLTIRLGSLMIAGIAALALIVKL